MISSLVDHLPGIKASLERKNVYDLVWTNVKVTMSSLKMAVASIPLFESKDYFADKIVKRLHQSQQLELYRKKVQFLNHCSITTPNGKDTVAKINEVFSTGWGLNSTQSIVDEIAAIRVPNRESACIIYVMTLEEIPKIDLKKEMETAEATRSVTFGLLDPSSSEKPFDLPSLSTIKCETDTS